MKFIKIYLCHDDNKVKIKYFNSQHLNGNMDRSNQLIY